MKRAHVVVDMRFIAAAGVGTYIENVVPAVMDLLPDVDFTALGMRTRLSETLAQVPGEVRIVECQAPMYSLREQFLVPLKIPGDATAAWFPHVSVPLLARIPTMVTIHDAFQLAMPELLRSPLKAAVARRLYGAVGRRAKRILTVSEFSKRELTRLARIPAERVSVTPLGVDPSWYAVPPSRPHPRPYVVFVGSVKPHKNVGTLLAAFRMVADRIPHDLVIVGRRDGMLTPDFGLQQGLQGIEDRVRFTGYLDKAAVQAYVANADALAHPSLYEGFGLTPLEAMAARCPTIVARTASLPEVCGDATLYFDPLDADALSASLLLLLEDARLRQRMVAAGLSRAHRFNWALTAQRTAEALTAVLAG